MSTVADPLPNAPETAPSYTAADEPTFARFVGFVGLFALVLGSAAVLASRLSSTPRMIGEGWGFLLAAGGVALMLYHAVRDGDPDVRWMYGGLGVVALVLALAAALVPGPVFAAASVTTEKVVGSNLAWAVGFGLLSLLFLAAYARHETDEPLRTIVRVGLLAVGALLTAGCVAGGAFEPGFLAGPGLALVLLGLGFLCAYLANVDTATGPGYRVAFALGLFGAVVALAAVARTAAPVLLYEGPAALRKPNGDLDAWKVLFRVLAAAALLAPAAVALARKAPLWLTAFLGVVGLAGAGVLVTASVAAPLTVPAGPFLVPGGVALVGLGLLFVAVSLGVCADGPFVTLARRELGAYFVSPIAYLVLAGMACVQWLAYRDFLVQIGEGATALQSGGAVLPEPIVRFYFVAIYPVFAVLLLVPALTMRLLAEERRSGSLEVLLTAPVGEATVVLAKFLSTWLFFMLCWLPAGLFLIALRVENGAAFDYRPLLSFYVALAACGAGFVAMGLFCSAVSPNQIVAAVLAMVGMVFFLACYFERTQALGLGPTVQAVMARLSFVTLWQESLNGQLPVRNVLVWLSLAVFFLFGSVKVLEARRWK